MAQLLDRRPWVLCNDPFPHIRAESVFTSAIHHELEAAFDTILSGGQLASWPEARFTRNMPGYDASAVDFDIRVGWPFSLFVSRPWHDLFAGLFAVDGIRCVSGSLHHHAAGSRDGFVHNDLNPGWFAATGGGEDVVIPRGDLCNYRNGTTSVAANVTARETVRGVAIIYYLNNPEWCSGDGGETGLYRAARDAIAHCVAAVPPLNNSLLAFECSPNSLHAFRKNSRHARNCVCVWIHRRKETVLARWGSSAIVPWQ
ncbi:MAG TPA: 2OG-Fe(II) oxygenase [Steroidobacteraceae bacterium]|nr:2OG-Fe(II) oxygenase [Steroidobacteraceae bacterium]